MPKQPEPSSPERTVRSTAPRALRIGAVLVALTALLVVGSVTLGTALGREDREASPAGTVRAFLTEAVIDRNGVVACRYLTPRARQLVEATTSRGASCAIAMSASALRLGGRNIIQESSLKRLDYRVDERGGRAQVTVGRGAAAQSFSLRRATPAELREFQPPPTHWRIDSGVQDLVAGA